MFSAFFIAFSVSLSISDLFSKLIKSSLVSSFSDMPAITFNERFESVSVLFTSLIIFDAVAVSVFTIISDTRSVKSCSVLISFDSCCLLVASIVCSIKVSFICSSIAFILSGSVSTIAFKTFADNDPLSESFSAT